MKLHPAPRFGAVRLDNQVAAKPLKTLPTTQDNGWEKTEVWTLQPDNTDALKKREAVAEQKTGATTDVRFFQGKGGFCAIVTTDDLTYIALPGSKLELPDTKVSLPGSEITGSPLAYKPASKTPTQKVTKQAMILGAGMATRFEPISGVTTGFPKPGVPLVGKDSVIVALAKHLQKHGIEKIIVNTYYMPERVKEQLNNNVPGMQFVYIDELEPSGTAGGLVKALDQGVVDTKQPILIMQGDAVTDADLSHLLTTHKEQGAKVTLGVQEVPDEDVSKVAILQTDESGADGKSGYVKSYKEKPSLAEAGNSRLGSIGFYVLSPEVFESFKAEGKGMFAKNEIFDYALNFFPALLKKGEGKKPSENRNMFAQMLTGYWNDIGRADQYVSVVKDLYAGRLNMPLPKNIRTFLDKGVIYWPGTKRKAQRQQANVQGNVIVAQTPAKPGRKA